MASFIRLCAATSGVLIATMLLPLGQAEAGQCGIKRVSYFVGYQGSIDNIERSSSYLTPSQPSSYCAGGDGRQISAWVMLADSGESYAQIGLWPTSSPGQGGYADHVFTQKTVGSSYNGMYITANANLTHRYAFQVLYSSTCGCLQMIVDNSVTDRTPYNPFGNWAQPFRPVYAGEAFYREEVIVGRSSSRAKFDALGVQDLSGNLYPTPCVLSQLHDAWGVQSSGCRTFYIWGA